MPSISSGCIRLCYELHFGKTRRNTVLIPKSEPTGTILSKHMLREHMLHLSALDQLIARELCARPVFGQLTDVELARLIPLLVKRNTSCKKQPLVLEEMRLQPRLHIVPSRQEHIGLTLRLQGPGQQVFPLDNGRLICGNQAFFVMGATVFPVHSPDPAGLALWAAENMQTITDTTSPTERDKMVHMLIRSGIPEDDLSALAIKRGSPRQVCVRISDGTNTKRALKTVCAYAQIKLDYDGHVIPFLGLRPKHPYAITKQQGSVCIIERDASFENSLGQHLRQMGFRFLQDKQVFVLDGDNALQALDPNIRFFPKDWSIDRTRQSIAFREDLDLSASIAMPEAQGQLSVGFDVSMVDHGKRALCLVEFKELLAWLSSGKQHLKLQDGSFVAPSPQFARKLRIAKELGADTHRVLVSPMCIGLLRTLQDQDALNCADAATQDWLNELAGMQTPRQVDLPVHLKTVLRDYQARGLDWLAMLHRHRLTGILADDMGLGKTVQTLALLLRLREQEGPKPSLVIAPTSVVSTWRDEAIRFTPGLSVLLWQGLPKFRLTLSPQKADVVVTSYAIVRKDIDILSRFAFRYVVLDEAQSAKNASTQNARSIRKLKSDRRLALTGTPIENRPEELWAAFDFLAPGFLGSASHFKRTYVRLKGDKPDNTSALKSDDALFMLRTRVRPFVLRRLKQEVAPELPPKMEHIVRCDMFPAQQALYDHVAQTLHTSLTHKIERVGVNKSRLDVLAALMRLRQICADPRLLPVDENVRVPPSAKLDLFVELMREALAAEHRVIVFSQFVKMQQQLIKALNSLQVDPLWLHGRTRNRNKVVKAFQDPKGPPVIVVSLRAGGTGLTLTRADTVMHYDPWWNPAVERQATDRAHRLGQTKTVSVYKLVCRNTIEERVLALAQKKEALASMLLWSEGGTGAKQIDLNDVIALFRPEPVLQSGEPHEQNHLT